MVNVLIITQNLRQLNECVNKMCSLGELKYIQISIFLILWLQEDAFGYK